jgi:hypothetical protein
VLAVNSLDKRAKIFRSSPDMKTGIPPVLITIALVCFALVQNTLAVSPAPDGGYPGANTAEGTDALLNLSSGIANTAVGNNALRQNTTGSWNVALGSGTLASNTPGNFNMAIGTDALTKNTANFNLAIGFRVGFMNTTGNHLTGIGAGALQNNTTAGFNTAIGADALAGNTIGSGNTTIGSGALQNNTTGNDNIALGNAAGLFLTTGDDNIDIGNNGEAGDFDTIRIGSSVQGAIYLAGIAGQFVGAGGTTCYVDNDGKLGVFLSSRRFKTDIADMGAASETLLVLRPVTFHYKPELDKTCTPQFGLVAEEVAKVNPDLVTRDAKGELTTVRYEAVNAMLLNEFLKEHKKTEELEATVASLITTVKEQAAQIQKVSAELQASRPAPLTVNNP